MKKNIGWLNVRLFILNAEKSSTHGPGKIKINNGNSMLKIIVDFFAPSGYREGVNIQERPRTSVHSGTGRGFIICESDCALDLPRTARAWAFLVTLTQVGRIFFGADANRQKTRGSIMQNSSRCSSPIASARQLSVITDNSKNYHLIHRAKIDDILKKIAAIDEMKLFEIFGYLQNELHHLQAADLMAPKLTLIKAKG